jgi:hypothetical protein
MNATAITSRLIGDIFVGEGLITDEQLEQALDEQQTTGQRLGEVLITRFGISRPELASALGEQLAENENYAVAEGDRTSDSRDLEALSSEWSTSEGKPVDKRPIGQIFVECGTASEEQLEQALQLQRETGQRLGEILVEQGVLSRVELTSALSEQLASLQTHRLPSSQPEEGPGGTPTADAEPTTPRIEPSPVTEDLCTAIEQLVERLSDEELTDTVDGTTEELKAAVVELQARVVETDIAEINELRHSLDSLTADLETHGNTDLGALTERVEVKDRLAELVDGQRSDEPQLAKVANDHMAPLDRLQEGLERAQSAAGARLDKFERRLADAVTPAQLSERVNSLTSGMLDLSRLIDELSGRLSLHSPEGIDTVELQELRAQLADHGHEELVGVVDRVAELERRLSAAATSAELDQRLERALTAHAADLGSGLDALAHSMKQVASSRDLNRLKRTVDLLSHATTGANELAAGRLEQLEARTEEAAAVGERLQAALTETADRSDAADERLRESLVDVTDRTERRLTAERSELQAHLSEAMQKLQIADAENLSSLRGSIDGLAVQLAEQRRCLEAQARTDVECLEGRIEQQNARAEEDAADAARATELIDQEMQRLEAELRGRLERHADRFDEQRRMLEEVRDAGEHALQEASASVTQRLADVEQHVTESAVGLKADLGQLGKEVAGQAVDAAQESAAARADLARLHSRLEDLTGRLEGHEDRTVEDTAEAQKEIDEVRSGISALGARLDVDSGTTTRKLAAIQKDLGRLHVQVEQLALRFGDQTARAADATTAVHSELETLRESLVEREAAAEEGLRSLVEHASACTDEKRREGDKALDARIDETRGDIAVVLKKVAEGELKRRSESANAAKVAVAGREALRNGLALIAGRLEQVEQRSQRMEEATTAAIGQTERGLTDVAIRSAEQTAESQRDLRAELAKTADSYALLDSHVEELSRSHEVGLGRAEEALQSLGVDELRAQVAALQSQVDAQTLQARAQSQAGEKLREGFAQIVSKLIERQQTFQSAGEELQSTFEELGQTIRKPDE